MDELAVVSGAARAASYNMLLQFGLRVSTFVLNAFILHRVSLDVLGIVNIRLTLLYSTILFLTKEAFERACLSKSSQGRWRQVINMLWCTVPLAVLWGVVLSFIWLRALEDPSSQASIPGYTTGVICFTLSSIIEVAAEPLYVVGQAFLFVRLKVILLGISQAVKCVIIACLCTMFPDFGILIFSIAQVISSLLYAAMYHGYFIYLISWKKHKKDDDFPFKSVTDLYPSRVPDQPLFDVNLAGLTWSFFKQSFLKQILTEGEKYVMTFMGVLSYSDQGVYDVVANLGSLAARFIFLPIEENSYLMFSQLLKRGLLAGQQNEKSLSLCLQAFGVVLKVVTIIGAVILVFGYANSYLALYLYGGSDLSSGSGPSLLRWHCLYVLIIAINGTTEAFVFAAMSQAEVDTYNKKMVLFSVLFLFSSWLLTVCVGSVGFILANCLNMIARIVHSIYFIRNYLADTQYNLFSDVVPSKPVIASLLISLAVTSASELKFCHESSMVGKFVHVGVSGLCLLAVLGCVVLSDRKFVVKVKDYVIRKPNRTDKDK